MSQPRHFIHGVKRFAQNQAGDPPGNTYLVMAGEGTLAERGAERVHQSVEGNAKTSFTFLAMITAEGTKFPLILVAKGKTERCNEQLGRHEQYEYETWHSPSGWCTLQLMRQYVGWLRGRIPGEPIRLVMDQYVIHTTQ
jgi:hypothetical protein